MPRSHLSPPLRKLGFVEVLAQNTSSTPRLEAGGTVARCHFPAITGAALQHWGHTGIAPREKPIPTASFLPRSSDKLHTSDFSLRPIERYRDDFLEVLSIC